MLVDRVVAAMAGEGRGIVGRLVAEPFGLVADMSENGRFRIMAADAGDLERASLTLRAVSEL